MKKLLLLLIIPLLFSCNNKKEKKPIVSEQKSDVGDIEIDHSLIVIDENLIWMKNDFSYIKGRFLYNWKEIFEWENEINNKNYADFNDWRVPTIEEYRSINNNKSDRERYYKLFNFLDSNSVWGPGPYAFWSKNTPNEYTASYISFIDGFATSGNRDKQFSNPYSSYEGVELGMSVRLVRDTKNLYN